MAGALARRSEDAKVPALNMANRFQRYKPEEEKVVRPNEVVEDPTLKQLKEAWKAFEFGHGTVDANYARAMKAVKALKYSASDVEKFSVALEEFQDENDFAVKSGLFLSALINNGKGTDFVIHTLHLAVRIGTIGYDNMKNITVNGNAGAFSGLGMKGGSIIVNGDAGPSCGIKMEGGLITVNGNAGENCGEDMKYGLITVNGDADAFCGLGMTGGAIIVKDNAGQWCGHEMKGGSITVNGDAGGACGSLMTGGSIMVGGNAGKGCGDGMKGGSIIGASIQVYGKIASIADDIVHGKIFHKGKLIVDK